MPYSASDVASLPANVQEMGADQRRQWVQIYNSAFARCRSEGGDDCEGSAFRQANGVLKKAQASRDGHGTGLRRTIKDLRARFGGGDSDSSVTETVSVGEPFFEDGNTIWREGLVFRAGDYPDKAYAMTPEEIKAAAAAFEAPVPVDLEHVPTVLDGKLGELVTVQASPDGAELRGLVALPRWLDQAIGTSQRKISATWNRQTKQLEGLALVLNPRVADAALMAAFSAANPSHTATQQDAGAGAGASASPTDDRSENGSTASEHSDTTPKEGTHVSGIRDRIVALFNQLPEEQLATLAGEMEGERRTEAGTPAPNAATTGSSTATVTLSNGESAAERRLREQLAASEADNRRIRAERIAEQAASFADHYIKGEGRAFPAERESIMQMYVQAATDDLLLPGSVTFSDGKTASRVAVIKAALDARPTHQLTAEQLAPGIFAALVNRDTTTADASKSETGLPPEELRKLIGRTTLGKSVLDHTDRGGVATNGTSH